MTGTHRHPRPAARLRRPLRRAGLVLACTLVMSTVAASAFAYWTATGHGTGSVTTGTLNAPTGVVATTVAGSGSVAVRWAAPSGTAPQGYAVRRTRTSDGSSAAACAGSPAGLVTATSCTDAGVADGTYTYAVTSVFAGWTATGAPSAPVAVTTVLATSTALASSANPSVVGQPVTYTATVTAAGGTPPGTVTFRDGGTAIACAGGTQALAGGSATCQVTYSGNGSHSITAVYNGSAAYTTSTSSPVAQAVGRAATSTAISSSANPSVTGQLITLTATVTVTSPGSGLPTGTVAFTDGAAALSCTGGSPTLSNGTATCRVALATAAAHSLGATYSGDADFTGSTSAVLTQTVGRAATTTTVTSSANPSLTGQVVTYTATVATAAPGSGTATGSVVFKDGATPITCTGGSQTLAGGIATCQVAYAATGSHAITAVYAGDAALLGSTSAALTQVVNPPLTITSVVRDAGNKKVHFTGTGAASTTVVVTICAVNAFPCAAPVTTSTASAPATTNWVSAQSLLNLAASATYFAQASQGGALSPVFTFSTAGL